MTNPTTPNIPPPSPAMKKPVASFNAGSNPDIIKFMGGVPPTDPRAVNTTGPVSASEKIAPMDASPADALKPDPAPLDKADEIAPKTPFESYLDQLKEFKVSPEEAAGIVDALIHQGYYEEKIQLTKRCQVTLRTRSQGTNERLDKALQSVKPEFSASYINMIAQINLANSMVQYGKFNFIPHKSEEEFTKTLEFVKQLPGPIFQALINHLNKFDEKLATIVSSPEALSSF